jgi:hypothetical protein
MTPRSDVFRKRPRGYAAGQLRTATERGLPMPLDTKEQLYREAKRLRIKGRSKMNKGQLKAAISRQRV